MSYRMAKLREHWYSTLVPYWLRSWHEKYAKINGYFWLPCPLCETPFGGHELRPRSGRPCWMPHPEKGEGAYKGICPKCTKSGKGAL